MASMVQVTLATETTGAAPPTPGIGLITPHIAAYLLPIRAHSEVHPDNPALRGPLRALPYLLPATRPFSERPTVPWARVRPIRRREYPRTPSPRSHPPLSPSAYSSFPDSASRSEDRCIDRLPVCRL